MLPKRIPAYRTQVRKMVSRKDIQATCDDIVREFAPLQVILFGSYAYGTPSEYSDVDLLVVMPVEKSKVRRQASEIQERIPRRFNMDILVRSPEEIAYRISHNDWFLREVTEKGEVLYESENSYFKPHKRENTEMNPLTLEWIELAEEDYAIARLIQREQLAMRNGMCFHAQQCAEKYLKAWLQEVNVPVPRTHNLEELLNLILPTIPTWSAWKADLSKLSKHAVDTRYVGQTPTTDDAEKAMQICEQVRQAVREQLKLPIEDSENNP